MNDISKARFDALASYCRDPLAAVLATELRWLEFAKERVLATLLLDTDGEFSVIILARDLKERMIRALLHRSRLFGSSMRTTPSRGWKVWMSITIPGPNTLSIPQWSWGQHVTVSSVMAGPRAWLPIGNL
jgi:hypothetical protein